MAREAGGWIVPYPARICRVHNWVLCVRRAVARELSLSVHTVRTHIRHLFTELGTHGRTEAVARARVLGLLAPSPSPHAP
jgi:hypothetical protein